MKSYTSELENVFLQGKSKRESIRLLELKIRENKLPNFSIVSETTIAMNDFMIQWVKLGRYGEIVCLFLVLLGHSV